MVHIDNNLVDHGSQDPLLEVDGCGGIVPDPLQIAIPTWFLQTYRTVCTPPA